jgi:hypothetical protein
VAKESLAWVALVKVVLEWAVPVAWVVLVKVVLEGALLVSQISLVKVVLADKCLPLLHCQKNKISDFRSFSMELKSFCNRNLKRNNV